MPQRLCVGDKKNVCVPSLFFCVLFFVLYTCNHVAEIFKIVNNIKSKNSINNLNNVYFFFTHVVL